jgi:hypothetical protein
MSNFLGFILIPFFRCAGFLLALLWLVPALTSTADAQTFGGRSRPLITQSINDANMAVLAGNTRPEARNPANDRGVVPDNMPLQHMMLHLKRPAEQEQALATLIEQLHDPKSPNFHHWISASEIGAQFGPAASDIQTIVGWLSQRGFTVNTIYANNMVIEYSGTAGQVRAAFHTQLHYLDVNGATRFANTSDPQIPAALTSAVVGVTSLHNIPPKAMHRKITPQFTGTGFTCGPFRDPCELVTPPDLATIYNFNPVFTGGNTGQGQTIYLIEDTNLFGGTAGGTNSDWATFRSTFGLSSFTGASVNTVHPGGCTDPGVNGDDGEAILDAEYASAAAPGAAIVIASCTDIQVAVQNTVNLASPPPIMSVSYGFCESGNGAASNAAFNTAYQTGAAGGMSIFVSSGDGGADGCDNHDSAPYSTSGISANGLGSSVYNVSVGGTDFSDSFSGTNSTYWNAANTSANGSAKSYIPEIPWNDSCGSQLIATHLGFATTYGSAGLCNAAIATTDGLNNIGAGSGAPSSCATGSGATCAGWAKPSWQSGLLGNPADGVRDLPDVSLFSASGVWGHAYVFCYSDTANGGAACTATPIHWSLAGGTSFASPIWAGIQALINQKAAAKQGLPTPRIYALAAAEFGAGGSSTCNASNGNTVDSSCVFYDVTLGDEDVPCHSGSPNCYDPSGTIGVLSTSTASYAPAFKAQTGWDFATGIGTVNVANLVSSWVPSSTCKPLTSTHDFNADCLSDILWRDTAGDIGMWFMNGTTLTASSILGNVDNTWTIFGQGDLNGDGHSDILWRNTNGDVGIWLMNGPTVAATSVVGNVASTWTIIGTGDFNKDGKSDILWRNTNGDVAMWFMNGTSLSSTALIANVPGNWTVVGTGDFDGDGHADILWRSDAGDVGIWLMNGPTIVSSVTVGNVPLSWAVVGTGDFTGDGKSDILWRNANGDVGIWVMNGATISSAAVVGNVPAIWSVVETGDFDGDGKSDLLWRDTSGNVAIWLMNGFTLSSSAIIENVPATWGIQSANAD